MKQISNTINSCFIQRVIRPHVFRQNLKPAPYHKKASVKTNLDQFNINLQFFPLRMTRLVQPADVSWFKSIKSEYCKKWTTWYTKISTMDYYSYRLMVRKNNQQWIHRYSWRSN